MPHTTPPPAYDVIAEVPYLGEGRRERLDVYLPIDATRRGQLPAVLLIHGGGWRLGDKADARERMIGGTLAGCGYVVASINYALNKSRGDADGRVRYTGVAWPRNLEDCETALAWLETEGRAAFGVNPSRLAVMGSSAGGHLAMMLAARHPGRVRAVVSLYGVGLIDGRRREASAGITPEETEARATAASPVFQMDARTPPILLIHGTADTMVPVAHARMLAREFVRRGVPHARIEVPGAGHSFDLRPAQHDLRPEVAAFLGCHLAPR
jgi:acetyl esterase/lipase